MRVIIRPAIQACLSILCIYLCLLSNINAQDIPESDISLLLSYEKEAEKDYFVWAQLKRDGKCQKFKLGYFQRKKNIIKINDVPIGKYTVNIIPFFGKKDGSLKGTQEIIVSQDKKNLFYIPVKQIKGIIAKIKIIGPDSKTLKNKNVQAVDCTDKHNMTTTSLKTNNEGIVSFYCYPDRKYKLSLKLMLPQFQEFESQEIHIKEAFTKLIVWEIDRGRVLKIRFVSIENGKKNILKSINNVFVYGVNGGSSFPVEDGILLINKNTGLLKGSFKATVELGAKEITAGYLISDNSEIKINDDKVQLVDVIVKKKVKAMIAVKSLNESKKQISAKLFVTDQKGNIVTRQSTGGSFDLSPGKYNCYVWNPEFQLEKRSIELKEGESKALSIKMSPNPKLKGKVSLKNGSLPPQNTFMWVRYPDNSYAQPKFVPVNDKGSFEAPVDINLKAVLIVSSRGYASKIVEVDKTSFEKPIMVKLDKGCCVKGKITYTNDIELKNRKVKIIWSSVQYGDVPVYMSRIKNKEYEAYLNPGKYIPNVIFSPVFDTKNPEELPAPPFAVKLPHVSIPEEKPWLMLAPLIVDKKLLKSRVSPDELFR